MKLYVRLLPSVSRKWPRCDEGKMSGCDLGMSGWDLGMLGWDLGMLGWDLRKYVVKIQR